MTPEQINFFAQKIAENKSLNLSTKQATATIMLLEGGATVPFIARYRKEMTGSLDEVQIAAIRDGLQRLKDLEKRREAILKAIDDQDKLTPSLKDKILKASTLTALEDIYLPYKIKKRTRATMAREKGLEPLAQIIIDQNTSHLEAAAESFLNEEKGVNDLDEALAGARDIIAEWVNENALVRDRLRSIFGRFGILSTKVVKGKEEEGEKFGDYFQSSEAIKRIPSHRFLAIQRGVKEGFLRMNIEPEEDRIWRPLERIFIKNDGQKACIDQILAAIKDSYKRLLQPSLETETRNKLKEAADKEAITVFVTNLKELLLAAPLGAKKIMAIDPGFRTGCKVVCLDRQGNLLDHTTIYPHDRNAMKRFEAMSIIEELVEKHEVEAVAIGNGTAGRETNQFFQKLNLPDNLTVVMVNESGASIYSASEVAREEFGDYDVTVRGTVSIGRRLLDPLAELVKIDPKSIGVGQYQHDVNQTALKQSLDDVVVSCVNAVGVEVNTASKELLMYLSGLGAKTAQNIIEFRQENGDFKAKKDLKKVKGIGAKAFEQAAGFIRIRSAKNPLDASAVHPESYKIVEKMAKDQNSTIQQLIDNEDLIKKINPNSYITDTVGLPTLQDIIAELSKPGRDPRQQFENIDFAANINSIEDLSEGMVLTGVILNVTNFGAFVDIGVHESGLVHISHLANKFVSDPKQVVKVNQKVQVKVISLDINRKRIGLSMKEVEGAK